MGGDLMTNKYTEDDYCDLFSKKYVITVVSV